MCPPRVSRIYFFLCSEYQDICSHPALCSLSFYQLHWQGFSDVTCKGISASWNLHLILNGKVPRFFSSHLFYLGFQFPLNLVLLYSFQFRNAFPQGTMKKSVSNKGQPDTSSEGSFPVYSLLSLHITDIFTFYILFKSQCIRDFTGSSPSLPFNSRACQVLSAEPRWFLWRSLCPRSFC